MATSLTTSTKLKQATQQRMMVYWSVTLGYNAFIYSFHVFWRDSQSLNKTLQTAKKHMSQCWYVCTRNVLKHQTQLCTTTYGSWSQERIDSCSTASDNIHDCTEIKATPSHTAAALCEWSISCSCCVHHLHVLAHHLQTVTANQIACLLILQCQWHCCSCH